MSRDMFNKFIGYLRTNDEEKKRNFLQSHCSQETSNLKVFVNLYRFLNLKENEDILWEPVFQHLIKNKDFTPIIMNDFALSKKGDTLRIQKKILEFVFSEAVKKTNNPSNSHKQIIQELLKKNQNIVSFFNNFKINKHEFGTNNIVNILVENETFLNTINGILGKESKKGTAQNKKDQGEKGFILTKLKNFISKNITPIGFGLALIGAASLAVYQYYQQKTVSN